MAFPFFRADARFFAAVFLVFNILLAVFNILSYRITSRAAVPCVVISAPSHAELSRVLPKADDDDEKGASRRFLEKLKTATTKRTPPTTAPPVQIAQDPTGPGSDLLNVTWTTELRGKYRIIKGYIRADLPPPPKNGSVTLTTQGTYEFLHHVTALCVRWRGPLSVAVYAPGADFTVAVRKINFLRQCGEECVRQNVTWHIIYDKDLGPELSAVPSVDAVVAVDGVLNCSVGIDGLNLKSDFRATKKMPYPINVARNVARLQAGTVHVLASDIELYPSADVIPRFLTMVREEPPEKAKSRHVYVLPIFEVKKGVPPPKTKAELRQLMGKGDAIFFHKWICDACQNFPRRDEWVKESPAGDALGVFHVTKRQRPRTAWEPIYIGTNAEPLYDERLTWEGKRDKMSQMYELCLMDYDFYILNNAFLVHAPGIKTLTSSDQRKRAPFINRNNVIHNRLLGEMRKRHGNRDGC